MCLLEGGVFLLFFVCFCPSEQVIHICLQTYFITRQTELIVNQLLLIKFKRDDVKIRSVFEVRQLKACSEMSPFYIRRRFDFVAVMTVNTLALK